MADMLVAPTELASWLKSDLDNLPTVELVIAAATAAVQDAASQRLVQATDTADLTGTTSSWLDLPQRPVTDVTSVTLDGSAVTDYVRRGHRLWRACGWATDWCAPSTVLVDYTHGWTLTPEPDQQLEYARGIVFGLAAAAFDNPAGTTREQIDDYAVQYEAAAGRLDAMPETRRALRRRYGLGVGSLAIA